MARMRKTHSSLKFHQGNTPAMGDRAGEQGRGAALHGTEQCCWRSESQEISWKFQGASHIGSTSTWPRTSVRGMLAIFLIFVSPHKG